MEKSKARAVPTIQAGGGGGGGWGGWGWNGATELGYSHWLMATFLCYYIVS